VDRELSRRPGDEQITDLARFATMAPTSINLQNWRFIAVRTLKPRSGCVKTRSAAGVSLDLVSKILPRLYGLRRALGPSSPTNDRENLRDDEIQFVLSQPAPQDAAVCYPRRSDVDQPVKMWSDLLKCSDRHLLDEVRVFRIRERLEEQISVPANVNFLFSD
jgi:nitroreductase